RLAARAARADERATAAMNLRITREEELQLAIRARAADAERAAEAARGREAADAALAQRRQATAELRKTTQGKPAAPPRFGPLVAGGFAAMILVGVILLASRFPSPGHNAEVRSGYPGLKLDHQLKSLEKK